MKWVLIVWYVTAVGGVTTVSPFNSQKACQAAEKKVHWHQEHTPYVQAVDTQYLEVK